jgi:hypothetical protein
MCRSSRARGCVCPHHVVLFVTVGLDHQPAVIFVTAGLDHQPTVIFVTAVLDHDPTVALLTPLPDQCARDSELLSATPDDSHLSHRPDNSQGILFLTRYNIYHI